MMFSMSEDTTQVVQNEGEQTPTNTETQPTEQTPKEETVGDTLAEVSTEKKVPDVVPYSRLSAEVKKRKELESQLADLTSRAKEENLSNRDVDADLSKIAEEYGLDQTGLDKVAKAIKGQLAADMEERLRPITEREANTRKEQIFNQHFTRAMENLPDLKDVVNPEVIKQLAYNPANANKTYTQLIQETYGGMVKGRETLESTVPRGGNFDGAFDYSRAKTDPTYFDHIMTSPTLKAKYNEAMRQEMSRR
jgi:hypothetical protein